MSATSRSPKTRVGPFWAAMREAERRIYRATLEATNGDVAQAAELLQVSHKWFSQRSHYLGGVRRDEPINEPPRDTYAEVAADAPRRGRPPKKLPPSVKPDDGDEDDQEDEDTSQDEDEPAEAPEPGGGS